MKSPNILIDHSWSAKIADFNLSFILLKNKACCDLHEATNPKWLAPEVLSGQGASTASDAYGFALVMYELLTWQPPWGRANPFQASLTLGSWRTAAVMAAAALPCPLCSPLTFLQVRRSVLAGMRPDVPPCTALPGPEPQAFDGLERYCRLMRCAVLWRMRAKKTSTLLLRHQCPCHPCKLQGLLGTGCSSAA